MGDGVGEKSGRKRICFFRIFNPCKKRIRAYTWRLEFISIIRRGMKKRTVILFVDAVLLVMVMACSIAYEGINITDDPEDLDRQRLAQEMTDMSEPEQGDTEGAAGGAALSAETPAPTSAPAGAGLPPITRTEINTYSVQAANYDCICAVDGDVTTSFTFSADTLEILDADGNPTAVYDKTGENTYSRSFMGYYILVDESGESTEVEEAKRDVIIFNDAGYVMEHYSGDSGSPCCVHTFTNK